MLFLFVLLVLFVAYSAAEYGLHLVNLRQILIRVQVNGTRGKSSVTRLIAAGLRGGGLRVVAKVTGTRPRFIVGDHEELVVRRIGKANIAEQLRIVTLARRLKAQALVVENMSLDPHYQQIENHLLIKPTHSVVTNVRADHLDVMGPTVRDVARAFSRSLPGRGLFFTAERKYLAELEGRNRPGLETFVADAATVADEEMDGFDYVEHKENVALALSVCEQVGVERKAALAGMKRSLADWGVLRIHWLRAGDKRFEFVSALAANDPDSIGMLWQMVMGRTRDRIVLVNCRRDRQDRSRQMAELARGFEARAYVATGGLTKVFLRRAAELGIPAEKLVDLGDDMVPREVFEWMAGLIEDSTLLFACGNTVGYGEELTAYFVEAGAVNAG